MPREFPRSRRIEEQIQRILSEILRSGARDPRLQGVIVTDVDVSRDLSVAWVYFNVLGGDSDQALSGLEQARGFLRSRLAAELDTRQAPALRFRFDELSEKSEKMDDLIQQAVASDRRRSDEREKD